MKISLKKFIIGFLVIAGVFQFTTNSILGPEVGFIPADGNWYPGENSSVEWKSTVSSSIHNVKFVLLEPLAFLAEDSDGAPPIVLLCYAFYWTVLAVVLYYAIHIFDRLILGKRS